MSYRHANINPFRGWNKILTDNMCDVLRSKLPPGNWPLLDQWSCGPRITRTTQTLVVSNTLRQTFSLTSNRWNTINYKPNAISTHFIKRNAPSVIIRNAHDVKLPSSTGGGNTIVEKLNSLPIPHRTRIRMQLYKTHSEWMIPLVAIIDFNLCLTDVKFYH